MSLTNPTEGALVVTSDGQELGSVERLDDNVLVVRRSADSGFVYNLPLAVVADAEENRVYLDVSLSDVHAVNHDVDLGTFRKLDT